MLFFTFYCKLSGKIAWAVIMIGQEMFHGSLYRVFKIHLQAKSLAYTGFLRVHRKMVFKLKTTENCLDLLSNEQEFLSLQVTTTSLLEADAEGTENKTVQVEDSNHDLRTCSPTFYQLTYFSIKNMVVNTTVFPSTFHTKSSLKMVNSLA